MVVWFLFLLCLSVICDCVMIVIDYCDFMFVSLCGVVLVLGNFDGFYQGYQVVIGSVIDWVCSEGCLVVVVIFLLYLMCYFQFDLLLFWLIWFDQCSELFVEVGVDVMLVFYFDEVLVMMMVECWIEDVIVGQIGVVGVVIGQDFIFGCGCGGNLVLLQLLGVWFGVGVCIVGLVYDDVGLIFFSCVCIVLQMGDCVEVMCLLICFFVIWGMVQYGDKLGCLIGFFIVNIDFGQYLCLFYGIYVVIGWLFDGCVL